MTSVFPAIRGRLGDSEFYSAVLTLGEASRLIEFVEEVDDWTSETDAEAKGQRRLNIARVEREMVPYLTEVPDHFYSSLTVEIRPAIDGDDWSVPFEPSASEGSGMQPGKLVLDGTETLCALDGQHRLKSIQLALRKQPQLAREHISVVFVPYTSLRRSQILFSDLNRYARSPSRSISLLFSHRDPVVQLARAVADRADLLKGRVELESTSLSKHTPNFITLSTLYEMTRTFLGDSDPSDPQEADRQVAIWQGLSASIVPWRQVMDREEHPAYLRQRYLVMHGVCQQALAHALAARIGAARVPSARDLQRLSRINWSIGAEEWEGVAVQGRSVSNTNTSVRRLAGLLAFRLGAKVDASIAEALVAAFVARKQAPPAALTAFASSKEKA